MTENQNDEQCWNSPFLDLTRVLGAYHIPGHASFTPFLGAKRLDLAQRKTARWRRSTSQSQEYQSYDGKDRWTYQLGDRYHLPDVDPCNVFFFNEAGWYGIGLAGAIQRATQLAAVIIGMSCSWFALLFGTTRQKIVVAPAALVCSAGFTILIIALFSVLKSALFSVLLGVRL